MRLARRLRPINYGLQPFQRGFWLKLREALVNACAVTKSTAIDITYVKAQRAAFAQKGSARHRLIPAHVGAGPRKSTRSPTSSAALMRTPGNVSDGKAAHAVLGWPQLVQKLLSYSVVCF